MFDSNSPIEQFIYTAGGSKKEKLNNADFGVYSKSKTIDDTLQSEIQRKLSTIMKGVASDYAPQYKSQRQLKPGSVPHGIFKKTYRDSDYEYVRILASSEIKIISESKQGRLLEENDYRDNPENAPFRIAATTLSDGRLMIVQERAINRIYSTADLRTGNYFAHALLFPKGTKLEDININDLKFRNGLNAHEWGPNGTPAPETLQSTTINELNNRQKAQQDSSIIDMTQLIDIYKKSQLSNKDLKSRTENKRLFNNKLNQGNNLLKARCLATKLAVNQMKQDIPLTDIQESFMTDIDIHENTQTQLLSNLQELVQIDRALDKAYEDNNTQQISSLESKSKFLSEKIKQSMENFSKEQLSEIVTLQKEYLKLSSELQCLQQGKKFDSLNGIYRMKDDYKAITKLEYAVNRMNKNENKKGR